MLICIPKSLIFTRGPTGKGLLTPTSISVMETITHTKLKAVGSTSIPEDKQNQAPCMFASFHFVFLPCREAAHHKISASAEKSPKLEQGSWRFCTNFSARIRASTAVRGVKAPEARLHNNVIKSKRGERTENTSARPKGLGYAYQ